MVVVKVELWNVDNFFGVIVPLQTGVIYSNQTGGTGCYHPEVEGVFIPLDTVNWSKLEDPLLDIWGDVEPSLIRELLELLDLNHIFEAPEKLPDGDWGEAWVPVVIRNVDTPELKSFIGKTVILTYPNSD